MLSLIFFKKKTNKKTFLDTLLIDSNSTSQLSTQEKNKYDLSHCVLNYQKQINKTDDGEFSNVYKATLNQSTVVAVKIPKDEDISLEAERILLERLAPHNTHSYAKYVVFYHGSLIQHERLHLVLGYCNGGRLENLIRLNNFSWSTWKIQRMLEVAKGLAHLHAHNIIHRDVKIQNILIHEENGAERAVLIDLNLSELDQKQKATNRGSALYFPPEVFLGLILSLASDIFPFGLFMIELKTGKDPYRNQNLKTEDDVCDFVAIQKKTDVPPHDLEPTLKTLVAKCFMFKPEERPSAQEIVEVIESTIAKNNS